MGNEVDLRSSQLLRFLNPSAEESPKVFLNGLKKPLNPLKRTLKTKSFRFSPL
jgi:hypothetical protein